MAPADQARPVTPAGASLSIATPIGTLAAKLWGPEAGRPLLALHGWLDNAASFDRLAPRLPGSRIVALDLPGHGASDHHPPGVPYAFVDLVAEVWMAVDALGWGRFALLGHSLGGAIASIMAGTFPERIERLALIESLGPLTDDADHAPERLAQAIAAERRRRDARLRAFPSVAAAAERLHEASGSKLEVASAHLLAERGLRRVEGGWCWRADPRLRNPSRLRLTEAQAQAFLRRIRCPSVLVRARDGYPYDEATLRARMAAVPGLQVVICEGGGHHLHLERPQEVADALAALLRAPWS